MRLDAVDGVLGCLDVGVRVVAGGESAEEDKDGDDDHAQDEELAQDRFLGAELGPGAAALRKVLLYLILAEPEPEHAQEGDGVAEHLEVADHGAPDENGGDDEEDILQDTAEGEDET